MSKFARLTIMTFISLGIGAVLCGGWWSTRMTEVAVVDDKAKCAVVDDKDKCAVVDDKECSSKILTKFA